MKTPFAFFSAAALAFCFCLAASAGDQKPSISSGDEKFIKKSAANSFTELKVAGLAVQKAHRPEVKEFAQMLVTDHTSINETLTQLAGSKGVQLSAIIDPSGASSFQNLERFSGKAFDEAFLKHMQDSHRSSIAAFEEASNDAEDSELKAFVEKTLPTLRAHFEKATKLMPPPDASLTPTLPPGS